MHRFSACLYRTSPVEASLNHQSATTGVSSGTRHMVLSSACDTSGSSKRPFLQNFLFGSRNQKAADDLPPNPPRFVQKLHSRTVSGATMSLPEFTVSLPVPTALAVLTNALGSTTRSSAVSSSCSTGGSGDSSSPLDASVTTRSRNSTDSMARQFRTTGSLNTTAPVALGFEVGELRGQLPST